jgi:hypothetical protein
MKELYGTAVVTKLMHNSINLSCAPDGRAFARSCFATVVGETMILCRPNAKVLCVGVGRRDP